MELEEVRRRTPGKEVQEALRCYACREAQDWIDGQLHKNPNITAQGLWNACPVGEWLEWLITMVVEPNEQATKPWQRMLSDIEKITESYGGFKFPLGPTDHKKAAKRLRAKYESPWLP